MLWNLSLVTSEEDYVSIVVDGVRVSSIDLHLALIVNAVAD